jgi:hypothetical protein
MGEAVFSGVTPRRYAHAQQLITSMAAATCSSFIFGTSVTLGNEVSPACPILAVFGILTNKADTFKRRPRETTQSEPAYDEKLRR